MGMLLLNSTSILATNCASVSCNDYNKILLIEHGTHNQATMSSRGTHNLAMTAPGSTHYNVKIQFSLTITFIILCEKSPMYSLV